MKVLKICLFLFAFVVLCSATHFPVFKEGVSRHKPLDGFGRQIANNYHLQYIKSGGSRLVDNQKVIWSLYFVDDSYKTLEQLRPQIEEIIKEFWQKISHDAYYAQELKRLAKNGNWQSSKINPDQIGLKIAFWNPEMKRPEAPFVAQVKVVDEKVYYYYADPNSQALQDPIVEQVHLGCY